MLEQLKEKIAHQNISQRLLVILGIAGLLRRYRSLSFEKRATLFTLFISSVLCIFIFYILTAPLPALPMPVYTQESTYNIETDQVKTATLLTKYLEPLKTRNLFKPSIPVPTEKRVGKTTAEQLAERLKFIGTSGAEDQLTALVFIPQRGPGSFKVGERVAEFVLKEITKDHLVLEIEDEQITLTR